MSKLRSLLCLFSACVISVAAWAMPAGHTTGSEAGSLRAALESQESASRLAGETIHAFATLRRFYAARKHEPVWSGPQGSARLAELLEAVAASYEHGLLPDDYHARALRDLRDDEGALARELLATDAYLTLGAHLTGGKVDPVSIEPDWTAHSRGRDLAAHLASAIDGSKVAESLAALEPKAPEYLVLKDMLRVYREALAHGEWRPIPPGPALKSGDKGPRVEALRERLRATGLLDDPQPARDVFDASVEAAVALFQTRIGLEADGIVGATTWRELNRSASQRVDQLRANLERWRWLPDVLGERHIRVNIADFRLEAREADRVVRVHDVVVGRTYRKTPVFSGQISYLVLNPWWETPDRLARLDKLPMFRKDPAAVHRLGFEVRDQGGRMLDPDAIDWHAYSSREFPFRLRQQPGPQNALGQVKMMFPNKHNVYLHDTPSRDLFEKNQRAFSSGCVRVSNALGLAQWLLDGVATASRERIGSIVASGKETRIDLSAHVPVYLLYLTAVVGPDREFRFVNDIYERDGLLIEALGRRG
ncbi:MAG: L,D-transpeptidase family protein [Burkholderiaceae bacterium]